MTDTMIRYNDLGGVVVLFTFEQALTGQMGWFSVYFCINAASTLFWVDLYANVALINVVCLGTLLV